MGGAEFPPQSRQNQCLLSLPLMVLCLPALLHELSWASWHCEAPDSLVTQSLCHCDSCSLHSLGSRRALRPFREPPGISPKALAGEMAPELRGLLMKCQGSTLGKGV